MWSSSENCFQSFKDKSYKKNEYGQQIQSTCAIAFKVDINTHVT